jgi:hypothetical protein
MNLTEVEKAVLERHGLTEDHILDAVAMMVKDAKAQAKEHDLPLMLGTPCGRHGNRLRTRHGHCCLCNPAALTYLRRYHKSGWIYVAYSNSLTAASCDASCAVYKVGGTAISPPEREKSLNNQVYGGVVDWRILMAVPTPEYGRLESLIHAQLMKFQYPVAYFKEGMEQWSKEIFRCSDAEVLAALRSILPGKTEVDYYESTTA